MIAYQDAVRLGNKPQSSHSSQLVDLTNAICTTWVSLENTDYHTKPRHRTLRLKLEPQLCPVLVNTTTPDNPVESTKHVTHHPPEKAEPITW